MGDVEIVMAIIEMEGDPNSRDKKGVLFSHGVLRVPRPVVETLISMEEEEEVFLQGGNSPKTFSHPTHFCRTLSFKSALKNEP